MVFVALDVQYLDPRAAVAAIMFDGWTALESLNEILVSVDSVEPYVPGEFYKRELPCLLKALKKVEEVHGKPDLVFVDGYVNLEPGHPGLGRRLYDMINLPVVGIAKTRFHQAEAVEVLRGASSSPLYVTTVGIDVGLAAQGLSSMSGPHRVPNLIKRADQLARIGARGMV